MSIINHKIIWEDAVTPERCIEIHTERTTTQCRKCDVLSVFSIFGLFPKKKSTTVVNDDAISTQKH